MIETAPAVLTRGLAAGSFNSAAPSSAIFVWFYHIPLPNFGTTHGRITSLSRFAGLHLHNIGGLYRRPPHEAKMASATPTQISCVKLHRKHEMYILRQKAVYEVYSKYIYHLSSCAYSGIRCSYVYHTWLVSPRRVKTYTM